MISWKKIHELANKVEGREWWWQKCRVCESRNGAVVVGEVRFTCGICLDTMKEESSTKCGHVFCKSCIVDAIRLQGKCPTCRTRMSVRSIRRIFFPQLQQPASSWINAGHSPYLNLFIWSMYGGGSNILWVWL